jgi:hypothetical protein
VLTRVHVAPHAPDGRREAGFEADARREPREEQAAWREDAPELPHHRVEVRAVAREVQEGAGNHGVHRSVGPRQLLHSALCDVRGRQPRRQPREEAGDARDRGRLGVDREHLESLRQEVRQVPPPAASGIEHPRPGIEPPPRKLVEQVDVDVAEPRAKVGGRCDGHARG